MVRTRKKKKRNYKKAPKNTRVFRCVQKVKKKNDIGAAIAICQSSTKQSYRTGKTLKKGGGNIASHHRILHRCPGPNAPSSPWYQPKVGDIVQVKNNFRDTFILAKQQFKQNDFWKILEISQESDRCVVKLIKMENIGASNNYKKKVPILKGDITYIYYTNIAGNPDGRDDNFRLIKRKTPEVSDKPPTVVSQEKAKALGWEKLGGRRKKTRKKRGGAPKFLCGKDEVFWPDIHFNELESILHKLQKDTAGTTLGKMVDNLPSISKNKGECHGCKELINELVLNTMPPTRILPIEDKHIIWLRRFTGVHKGRACTIMGGRRKKKTRKKRGGKTTVLGFPIPIFDLWQTKVKVNNTKKEVKQWKEFIEKKTGGKRRRKKTRKKRGGNVNTGNWYHITNSKGESFYGGVIAQYDNSIVLLIADGDTEFQWNSESSRKDNLSFSDPITNMDSIALASNDALIKAIDAWDKGKREITVKKGMLKTPPQSPRKGGSKSKRVKKLIKIFQQYPEIFPSGYFRFLGARLQNHIDKKTLWYKNGVILTWIKYQKTVKKKPKCIIKPGDVKLDQIVNKNQGNGAAKKIVLQFLKKFEKNRIWLEVRANNKRAIRFYKDRGFKRVCKIKFGEIPGIMMLKQV